MQWIKATLKLKSCLITPTPCLKRRGNPFSLRPNDYEDIVGIRKDRVILMRDNDVDFFSRAGSLVSSETLTFGDPPDIDVMLRYAHDLYLALDTATEKGYLLNASGSTEWESADDVFRLGFNRYPRLDDRCDPGTALRHCGRYEPGSVPADAGNTYRHPESRRFIRRNIL